MKKPEAFTDCYRKQSSEDIATALVLNDLSEAEVLAAKTVIQERGENPDEAIKSVETRLKTTAAAEKESRTTRKVLFVVAALALAMAYKAGLFKKREPTNRLEDPANNSTQFTPITPNSALKPKQSN